MPVPFTRRASGYTDEDINRFNRTNPTRMLEKYKTYPSYHTPELEKRYKDKGILDAYYADAVKTVPRTTPLEPLIPGTSSTPKSERERNEEFIRESFKNLPGNLEQIGNVNRERQKKLEELGYTPDPNPAQDALRELLKPIFPRMFGPQSSVPSRRQATIAKSSPRVMMPGTPIAQQPRVMVVDGGTNSVDTTEQVSPNPQIPQFSHMGHSMNKLDTLGIG